MSRPYSIKKFVENLTCYCFNNVLNGHDQYGSYVCGRCDALGDGKTKFIGVEPLPDGHQNIISQYRPY